MNISEYISISAVIPCYPPHVKYLKNIVTNILQQTVLPDEIIIALSETESIQVLKLEDDLNAISSIKIIITGTNEECPPGINRNRGAMISTCDYIMFLDADDVYHNQKIEFTKEMIKRYKPNLMLHSFHYECSRTALTEKIDIDKVRVITNDTIHKNTFGYPPKRNFDNETEFAVNINLLCDFHIAHGIATVKKNVFDKIRYTCMRRGEDGRFDRDIIWHLGNAIVCEVKLMVYKATDNIILTNNLYLNL